MKQIEKRIFGYWFEGDLYCPLCFSDLGKVCPDEIIFVDSIDAHFGKCHRCRWSLWGLYKYENYLERRQLAKKEFNISDDFSDLENSVLKEEIELVSLRVHNTDCSLFRIVMGSENESGTLLSSFDW